MSSDEAQREPISSEHEQQLERIVHEYMNEVAAGKQPDQAVLLRAHPDLAESLRGVFRTLQFLENAGKTRDASLLHDGDRLGEFRIVREIGRGGMGVVYEAVQTSLERRVALKVLPTANLLIENALERFRREALMVGKLHHSNIVPVYAIGEERGLCYYAMQLIEGQSLAHFLNTAREARQPLDRIHFQRVARWGRQIAEALAYAHSQHVIHRDVKPSNLLLDRRDEVWIFDFGLARLEGSPILTHTGDVVGTVRYMSPEQARGGSTALEYRSDIYSLGATLYELASLQPVYESESRAVLLHDVIQGEPQPLRRLVPRIPRDLETIVAKCMRKDVAERYPCAADAADDLRRFLDDAPIKARPMPLIFKIKRWIRRHRAIAAAAASVVALTFMATMLVDKLRREEGRRALDEARAVIIYDRNFERGAALLERAEKNGADEPIVLLYRGLIPLLNQESEGAIRQFEELLRRAPESLEARYALARARLDQGEFYDGQRLFESEGDRRPETALGWFLRGYALSLHRPAEALSCYDRALELQANFVPAILERATYRGLRLMEEGRREDLNPMLNDVDAVVVFRPDSSLAYYWRAWVELAAAAYATTQPDLKNRAQDWLEKCRTDLDQAITLNNPQDTKIDNVRGAYLRYIGDYTAAADSYARSNELHQRQWHKPNPFLLHAQAIALHAAGDVPAALEVAENASRLTPGFYDVLLHHAVLLAECGRMDEARAVCRRSLESEKSHATGLILSIAMMEFLGGAEEARPYIQTLADRDAASFTFEHLEQSRQRLDWDAPIVAFFDGRLESAAFLESAGDLPSRKCEYAFLAALRELSRGRRKEGLDLLQTCLDTGIFIYAEHRYADVFLARARTDPQWPHWIDNESE